MRRLTGEAGREERRRTGCKWKGRGTEGDEIRNRKNFMELCPCTDDRRRSGCGCVHVSVLCGSGAEAGPGQQPERADDGDCSSSHPLY